MQIGRRRDLQGENQGGGIDPETFDVTLEDGTKFGVQQVRDGEIIYEEAHQSQQPRKQRLRFPAAGARHKICLPSPAGGAILSVVKVKDPNKPKEEKGKDVRANGALEEAAKRMKEIEAKAAKDPKSWIGIFML